MKGFYKVLLLVISTIVYIIGIGRISAAELTTSFSGYYWDRKSDDYHGSGSFRYYYLDGIDSYCLDPNTHEGGPLTLGDWNSTGISDSIKEKVLLIAYYGYNYQGHQTLEYRAATQAMIWETVKGGNTKVTFFTQRFGEGNELDISKEKGEIERLISNYKVKPSFDSKAFSALVGEQLVLNDSNGVLSNYNISINEATFYKKDNKLYITPYVAGKLQVKLKKKEAYTSSYKIFVSDVYQDQIIPGIIDNIEGNFIINSEYGKVNIQKKDSEIGIKQGEATLGGAKYGIYRRDNDILMGTITTDENGYVESESILSYGNYYLKELKSSIGYKLDSNKYYFDINSNSKNVHVDVFEDVIKGKIKITKQDSETNTCKPLGEGILSGAKYQIVDINNNVVDTITINNDCTGTSKELPYGKYKVKEIDASKGYKIDTNIYDVFIDSDNLEINVTSREEIIKGKIKITKQDSETNTCKPLGEGILSGAKYQIVDINNNVVDTIIINNDCTGTSKELPYGKYKVKEIEASKGYKIDNNIYDVSIDSDNLEINVTSREEIIKGKIKIIKQDSETNTCKPLGEGILSGAKYQIIDINNNVVDTIIINDNCTSTSKELPYGKYKVKEIEASKGYKIDNNIYDVSIDSDNLEINVISKEDIIKNRISILKQYDYVEGNSMFVNAEANIIFEIYDSNNFKYDTIITDKNGYALVDLPYGTWRFHQKNVVNGYQKIHDFYVNVDDNSPLKHYYNILNNKIAAYLKLVKKDSTTGNVIKLSGTKFKILNMDTNEYVSQYVGGKLLDTFETDENGIMTTYLKLEAGNYKVKEIEAPKGYLLNDEGVIFSVNDNTEFEYTSYGTFVTVEYMNDPVMGQLEIKKYGEIFKIKDDNYSFDKIPLSSVKFNIYASEDIISPDGTTIYYRKGTRVDRLTTNEDGYVISKKLPLGKYYLVETKTNSNYILNKEKYYFELKETDATTPIVLECYETINYLRNGNLEIIKKDADNRKVVPNTKIEIYTENDELIYTGMTNEDGKIILNKLPIGKYYIIETVASEGYRVNNEKIYFEIKRNNQNVKVTLKNEKIKSKVIIHKVDESNNSLNGVHINIYDENDKIIYKGVTDKDGNIEVELSYGKYYYKEISTIDGYIINDEKVYFNITNDNETFEFNLVNIKKEIEVPNTGANKQNILLPNLLIILGILLNIYGKKKIFM